MLFFWIELHIAEKEKRGLDSFSPLSYIFFLFYIQPKARATLPFPLSLPSSPTYTSLSSLHQTREEGFLLLCFINLFFTYFFAQPLSFRIIDFWRNETMLKHNSFANIPFWKIQIANPARLYNVSNCKQNTRTCSSDLWLVSMLMSDCTCLNCT